MIVFVIGLYKSGTSMVSSILEEIGCNSVVDRYATTKGLTGEYDIKEAYFVNMINNLILDTYSKGCIYFKNEDLPDEIDPGIQNNIKDFLARVKNGATFIKDPRFIGTIKYWIKALPAGMPYKIVYVDRTIGLKESFQVDKWFADKITDGDFDRALANLKENYYKTRSQYEGIEIDFDVLKKDKRRLAFLIYNYLTSDFGIVHKIYFHNYFKPSKELTELFSKQTPGSSGVWQNIIAVDKAEDADFEIVQDKTDGQYNTEKLIFLGREPWYVHRHDISNAKYNFHHERGESWLPQTWWVDQDFDSLQQNNSLDMKTKLLSVIDSGKTGLQGHNLRVDLIDKLVASDIDVDVFGKTQRYTNSPKYKGPLPERNKAGGLYDYRFNLAIENGRTDFYFSEKFCDPILCNTFPIYLGCKQISKFFPTGSYFELDPEKDMVDQVKDILSIPVNQLNYQALFEAKSLILNKYNLWNTVSLAINRGKVL